MKGTVCVLSQRCDPDQDLLILREWNILIPTFKLWCRNCLFESNLLNHSFGWTAVYLLFYYNVPSAPSTDYPISLTRHRLTRTKVCCQVNCRYRESNCYCLCSNQSSWPLYHGAFFFGIFSPVWSFRLLLASLVF